VARYRLKHELPRRIPQKLVACEIATCGMVAQFAIWAVRPSRPEGGGDLMRIAAIGTSGAGKTMRARRIAGRLELPWT
jgi:hypothetical protein